LRRPVDRGDGRGDGDLGLVGQARVPVRAGVALPGAGTGMTPERWREVKGLFDRVLDRPPDERAALLAAEARPDAARAQEVERLLAANDGAGDFLDTPALEHVDLGTLPPVAPLPDRIGPYAIETELGHGGMGTVYRAVRVADGFRQTVAIKLVRRGMDT